MDKTPLQINKLVDAPIAKEVYDRAIEMNVGVSPDDILVVLGVQWSDDFEPNGSSNQTEVRYGSKLLHSYQVQRKKIN